MALEIDCPTTTLSFGAVAEGRKKFKALAFDVNETGGSPSVSSFVVEVHLELGAAEFRLEADETWMLDGTGVLRSGSISIAPGASKSFEVFVSLSEDTPGGLHEGRVSLRIPSSGALDVDVTLDANVSAASPTDLVLVLDRSLSMGNATSTGVSRNQRMKDAASICLEFLNEQDRLAVVSFNDTARTEVTLGRLSDNVGTASAPLTRRAQVETLLASSGAGTALHPDRKTAIREAVVHAQGVLAGSTSKNVLFLSDGLNDIPTTKSMPSAGETRFAVGIVDGLTGIHWNDASTHLSRTAGSGRALLWTEPVAGPSTFKLEKYVTQTILGVVGTEVVLDPDGVLDARRAHVYEFEVTEADHSFEVVALCKSPELLQVRVERPRSPRGHKQLLAEGVRFRSELLSESDAADFEKPRGRDEDIYRPSKRHGCKDDVVQPDRRGQRILVHRVASLADGTDRPSRLSARIIAPRLGRDKKLPYTLLVVAKSDLKLDAQLHSTDLYVGAQLLFSAVVTQFDRHLKKDLNVTVELEHPDGDRQTYALAASEPGRYVLRLPTFRPGVYHARFIARGRSLFGRAFRREALATALVLPAGDRLSPTDDGPAPAAAPERKHRE